MANTWLIDYSAKDLTAAVIKSGNVYWNADDGRWEKPSGVIGYIDDITNQSLVRTKHITKPEYDDFVRNGLSLPAMYFEIGVDDVLGGYNAGRVNAQRALRGANALGWGGTILMACDRHFVTKGRTTITAQMWRDYLNGAKSVLGDRCGGYGFEEAADAAEGIVKDFVQCGSASKIRDWVTGWQDNRDQPVIDNIATDRVLMFRSFSTDVTQEDDMPTAAEVADAVWNKVLGKRPASAGGTNIQAGDAVVNGYLGEYYGGGDAGPGPAFKAANTAAANSTATAQGLNALGAQLAQVFTTIDAKLNAIEEAVGVNGSASSAQLQEQAEALKSAGDGA